MTAVARALLLFPVLFALGCGGDSPGSGSSNAPGTPVVSASGTVVPPAGAVAADYDVFATDRSEKGTAVRAGGDFAASIATDRTGMLMAVPREGSTSASTLGAGRGILLSPVFGTSCLGRDAAGRLSMVACSTAAVVTGDGGMVPRSVDAGAGDSRSADGASVAASDANILGLPDGGAAAAIDAGLPRLGLDANTATGASDGGATVGGPSGGPVLDATTTMLAALLMHPMLAHPDPDVSKKVGAWLLAKANTGWPELQAASSAFLTAANLDGVAFQSALAALFYSTVSALPESFGVTASGKLIPRLKTTPPKTATTSQGAVCTSVAIDNPETPSITVDDVAGTNLDYLCVVRDTNQADFPAGAESPAFVTPNRLGTVPAGAPIRSAFVSAKSYASYLDIVGNTIGLVSDLIGSATIGPNKAIPLKLDRVTEIRCLSGGYGTDADAPVYNYVAANLAADARSAFVHNVTAATIEVISAIPGADTAMKSEIGKDVLKKAVQQAVFEIESKANSQGRKLGAGDIYEIIYNVARAALNEAVDKSSEEWKKGKLEKLAEFLKWGGKSLVKLVDISGKLSNAGAAGSRAYALARPQSLMEYFLVAVGEPKRDAGMPDVARDAAGSGGKSDVPAAKPHGECRAHLCSAWNPDYSAFWDSGRKKYCSTDADCVGIPPLYSGMAQGPAKCSAGGTCLGCDSDGDCADLVNDCRDAVTCALP